MRDTSSTFDDTSTSDDEVSEDTSNNPENTDSQVGISAYYDKTELPKKKGTGFGRFKPDMPIGTFVIQEKQGGANEADIILNNRLGKNNSGVRVGGELKENKNFQARALELAKLTEIGRAATTAGFELYTNARGEPVFKIPEEYQESIARKATEHLIASTRNELLERFNTIADYIAELAALEARGAVVGVSTKKYTTTIARLIEGAKKEEEGEEFNNTVTVIEENLADMEEVVKKKENEKKDAELQARTAHEELTKNLDLITKERDDATSAASMAQEKASHDVAKIREETAHNIAEINEKAKKDVLEAQQAFDIRVQDMDNEKQKILLLIHDYSVALAHFLKTEISSENIIISLHDDAAESVLIESAQELNQIKTSFVEKPSQETLDLFKKKTESYSSLVSTLIREHPVKEQVHEEEKPLVVPKFFGIDMGWPSEAIKQEKKEGESTPRWVIIGKDGLTTELSNSALWSTLAARFDDVFTHYQEFFNGPERTQKIQNYSNLITNKNEIVAALLNLDTDKLSTGDDQDLLIRFKNNIQEAEESWAHVLAERELAKQKKLEQEKLLERLTTYDARLTEIKNLQETILPYLGNKDQQEALANAKDLVANKQKEARTLVDANKPLTEDLINAYRDSLDIVSGLLTTLKKDKDAYDIVQKTERDRLIALFKESEPAHTRISDQVDAIISDIASPTELAMVTGRFDSIAKERKNIVDLISTKQPMTEEMIKVYTKHLQDFDKGMLSGVQNRIRTTHQQEDLEAAMSAPKNRVLLPNGRLSEEEDEPSTSNPQEQLLKGLEAREENPLKTEYTKWAKRDFAGFIRWYIQEKKSWKDDDKNKVAAEEIVKIYINNLDNKKNGLEERKEEASRSVREAKETSTAGNLLAKQLDALDKEIAEVTKEIAYLKQESPKNEVVLSVQEEDSTPSTKRPFTNRLKTGMAGEIRPIKPSPNSTEAVKPLTQQPEPEVLEPEQTESKTEKVKIEPLPQEEPKESTVTPLKKDTLKKESPTFHEEEYRQEKPGFKELSVRESASEDKRRKDAVSKLFLVRLHTTEQHEGEPLKQLASIMGALPILAPSAEVTTVITKKSETIASRASWKDFLQTKELLSFASNFVDKKIGFIEMIRRYAPSVHLDPKNPASLSVVSTMNVNKLINGEEGVYGLDEGKRKELSDIVRNLDIIIRSVDAQKTLASSMEGEDFSSITGNETLEPYFDRALRGAEQATIQEERMQAKLDSLYKKNA